MLGKKRGSVLGMMLHDWSAKGWRAGLGVGKSGRISGFQEQGLSPRGVGTAWEMLSQAPPGTASHKRARKGSLAGTEQILQQAKWMQMELKQRENLNLHVLPRPGLEQLLGLVRQKIQIIFMKTSRCCFQEFLLLWFDSWSNRLCQSFK